MWCCGHICMGVWVYGCMLLDMGVGVRARVRGNLGYAVIAASLWDVM